MKKLLLLIAVAVVGYFGYTTFLGYTPPKATDCAIVVVNSSNSSAISELENEYFQDSLLQVCKNENSTIAIIRGDGEPKLVEDYKMKPSGMRKPSKTKIDQLAGIASEDVMTIIKGVQALEPEVDYVDMINQAARTFDSRGAKKLIIVGNNIPTKGVVNCVDIIETGKSVKDVIDDAKKRDAIPDLTGVEVEIYGFGATCSPQKDLTYAQRSFLKNLWEAYYEEANAASIVFYENASMECKTDNSLPYVTPVSIPEEKTFTGKASFYADDISFYGDSATFISPSAASQSVAGVVEHLKHDSDAKVLIVGTTASGNKDYCRQLSLKRAEAVKKLLADEGVSVKQIVTVGVGCEDPNRIPDMDAEGKLVESNAYKNRKVMIFDINAEDAAEYIEISKGE